MSDSSLHNEIDRILQKTEENVSSVVVSLETKACERLDPEFHRHRTPLDEVTAVFHHRASQFCFKTHYFFRSAVDSICEALKSYGVYGMKMEFNDVVDTSEVHINVCMHEYCNMLAEAAMECWPSEAMKLNEQLLDSLITDEMKKEKLRAALKTIRAHLDESQRCIFPILREKMNTLIKEVFESKGVGGAYAMITEITNASRVVLQSVQAKLRAWDGRRSQEMKESMKTCALYLQYECNTAVSRAQKQMVDSLQSQQNEGLLNESTCQQDKRFLQEVKVTAIFHLFASTIDAIAADLRRKIDETENGMEAMKKAITDEFARAIKNITEAIAANMFR